MPSTHDPPLNGLKVRRTADGKLSNGTVVASTIRGRPTNEAPFVQSEYTVEWGDGTTEGGLSREAVNRMSDNEWTSTAWRDQYFEAGFQSVLPPTGVSGIPGASSAFPLRDSRFTPLMTVVQPPTSKSTGPKSKSAATGALTVTSFTPQDKSRINDLFRPAPKKEAPPTSTGKEAPSPAILDKKASGAKQKQTPKAGGSKKGQKKRKADEESEPEEEEEEEEVEEEPVMPEFMQRTYPRELCFKDGDVPVSVYTTEEEDPDKEFVVDYIVDEVTYGRKKFALVKWLGFELDTTDWSPLADVKDLDAYKEFAEKRAAEKKSGKAPARKAART